MKRPLPKDINVYTRKDIIELIGLKNPIDSIIMGDIISEMDAEIYDVVLIKKGIAKIPYIGNLQRNRTAEAFRKAKPQMREYRDSHPDMTVDEYKEYKKQVGRDIVIKENRNAKLRYLFRKVRAANIAEYKCRYKILGKARADMYIWSICLMKPVITEEDEARY